MLEQEDEFISWAIDQKMNELRASRRPEDEDTYREMVYISKDTWQARMDYMLRYEQPYIAKMKALWARKDSREKKAYIARKYGIYNG
jgi:hypothetical protein